MTEHAAASRPPVHAEIQLRLASAVRMAITLQAQPLYLSISSDRLFVHSSTTTLGNSSGLTIGCGERGSETRMLHRMIG
jgi:hypothetical protein